MTDKKTKTAYVGGKRAVVPIDADVSTPEKALEAINPKAAKPKTKAKPEK